MGSLSSSNAGFMSGSIGKDENDDSQFESISVGNYLIIGGFYGAIIRHDKKLLVNTDAKEDYERSVLHFIKDGRVVRLDFVALNTQMYVGAGGLVDSRTARVSARSAKYMLKKYPKYVRDKGTRSTSAGEGHHEISLI